MADITLHPHLGVDLRDRFSTIDHLARMTVELREQAVGGTKVERLTEGLLTASLNAIRIMANDGYDIMENLVPREDSE